MKGISTVIIFQYMKIGNKSLDCLIINTWLTPNNLVNVMYANNVGQMDTIGKEP